MRRLSHFLEKGQEKSGKIFIKISKNASEHCLPKEKGTATSLVLYLAVEGCYSAILHWRPVFAICPDFQGSPVSMHRLLLAPGEIQKTSVLTGAHFADFAAGIVNRMSSGEQVVVAYGWTMRRGIQMGWKRGPYGDVRRLCWNGTLCLFILILLFRTRCAYRRMLGSAFEVYERIFPMTQLSEEGRQRVA